MALHRHCGIYTCSLSSCANPSHLHLALMATRPCVRMHACPDAIWHGPWGPDSAPGPQCPGSHEDPPQGLLPQGDTSSCKMHAPHPETWPAAVTLGSVSTVHLVSWCVCPASSKHVPCVPQSCVRRALSVLLKDSMELEDALLISMAGDADLLEGDLSWESLCAHGAGVCVPIPERWWEDRVLIQGPNLAYLNCPDWFRGSSKSPKSHAKFFMKKYFIHISEQRSEWGNFVTQ